MCIIECVYSSCNSVADVQEIGLLGSAPELVDVMVVAVFVSGDVMHDAVLYMQCPSGPDRWYEAMSPAAPLSVLSPSCHRPAIPGHHSPVMAHHQPLGGGPRPLPN